MLELIKNILWSPVTVLFVAITGAVIGFKNKFRAIKSPTKILKNTLFCKDENFSAFESMCTALGGTIGVGNTIGVAGAIVEGGAGAVLWMIVSSFFGMIIKEAEIFLAVKYKGPCDKFSGPMIYIEKGTGSKFFAAVWAISCILTAFGMGNFSQSMAAVNSVNEVTNIKKEILGMVIAFVIFSIISAGLGGIKKILASVIPIITMLFVLISFIILYLQRDMLVLSVINIFKSAFNFKSGVTGIKWSLFVTSLRAGFSRGIFTNEAGLGSASIVHSSSNEMNAEKQASWGVLEVFVDTVVLCTITALMILSSNVPQSIEIEKITLFVFRYNLGSLGSAFYAISIFIFAVSSILAWYFYAECSLRYMGVNESLIKYFKIIFALSGFLGSILSAQNILYLSDIFNALMLLINLTALLFLSNKTKSD